MPDLMRETAGQILRESKIIAVVGMSDKPLRPAFGVASYLQRNGYRIIPVNPRLAGRSVLGEPAYPDLDSIPGPIDVVDVFRRAELTDSVIDEAIAVGAKAVWLQLGIVNQTGVERAREAGLLAVHDRCMAIEHQRIGAQRV